MTTALDNLRAAARALVAAEEYRKKALREYDAVINRDDVTEWAKRAAWDEFERAGDEIDAVREHLLDLARQWAQEDDGGSSV